MEECKYCATAIIDKRSDAVFCSGNCRIKAHLHIKRVEEKQKPIRAAMRPLDDSLTEVLIAIAESSVKLKASKEKVQETEKQWKEKSHLYHQHYEKFRIETLGHQDIDYSNIIPKVFNRTVNNALYLLEVWDKRDKLKQKINSLEQELKKSKAEQEEHEQVLSVLSVAFEEIQLQMEKLQASLEALERRKQQSPVRRKAKKRAKPQQLQNAAGISVKEFMALQFESFTLPEELGQFLGALEPYKLSIALKGDAGAGKSYLLGALARLLSLQDYSICYFQLEQGLGKIQQQILRTYPVKDGKVVLKDQGSLEDIRQAAQSFDCVLIDSFGKVSEDSKVFDVLRNEFPDTIFISIFQKNSDGSTRGGSRADFDSSMTIDVIRKDNRPVAIMQKSRYGTQGWEYDVWADQIIKRFDKVA